MQRLVRCSWPLVLSLLFACSEGTPGPGVDPTEKDSGAGAPIDTGVLAPGQDAGFADATSNPGSDASAPGPDAGAPVDTGVVITPDAGTTFADATPSPDGSTSLPDASDPGPAVLNPGWIGGPCQTSADCPFTGGFCLTGAQGWPSGTCSQSCTRTCPDQAGPLNSVTFCIDDGNGDATGECVSRCDFTLSPTGCRSGYVCLPEKRISEATTVRNVCVPVSGVPGRAAPAFDIGAACATPSDCNRNTCITALPGGYCTQEACNIVGCPSGASCWNLGGTQETFFACLKNCSTGTQCRTGEGYQCDGDSTCWALPPPPPVCDLTGGPTDCSPYAAMATQDFVVVTKHSRRLTLCRGATAVGSYCVGLGTVPVGDKEREGDRKTPEGVFYIPRKIPNSEYYKAFLISYPDSADAQRGYAAGLITAAERDAIIAAQNAQSEPPQNTNLGGLIEIHGNGSGQDWTWGCIAADDSTIDVLWPTIDVGETVVVLP